MFLYDNDGNGEMEGCFKLRATNLQGNIEFEDNYMKKSGAQ